MTFDNDIIRKFRDVVKHSHHVATVCHVSPDGDALGSSLCMAAVLKSMGKRVTVITPDDIPSTLSFLPGADGVMIASYGYGRVQGALQSADTVMCLDFNELKRLDRLEPYVAASPGVKVMIDHHLNPAGFADLTISHPEKSSTSMVLFSLLVACGYDRHITAEAAACCCAGMMTDTGNFSYNSNDPDLYLIMARIVEKGVNKDSISKRIFDTTSERRLRIMGYCEYHNMIMLPEHRGAIITLSADEAGEFGYRKGDTESLVNAPLGIPDLVWSVYLRATAPDYVKVSMRSKGNYSVREICANHFAGGGHLNASGGEVHGTLDEALRQVLEVMPRYDYMLPPSDQDNYPPIIIKNNDEN